MTVTNTRVILHTPKTAGSSVRWPAIKIDGFQFSCQHCKYDSLPEQYKHLRKITFVRNPIGWYASRYFYDLQKYSVTTHHDCFTAALSERFTLGFDEVLPRFMNLTKTFEDENILNLFKKMLTYQVTNNYQCWLVSYFDNIRDIKASDFENKSLYQWWLDIIGVQYADAVYRVEDQFEQGMKAEFGEDVNIIHKNKSNKPDITLLYTQAMKELVLTTDIKIIQDFGYNLTSDTSDTSDTIRANAV